MSTTPGDSTWADTGLVPPDSSAPQDPSRTTAPVEAADQPRAPKPDLSDEGAPVDVDAQREQLAGQRPQALPDDAPEADAWEQAQEADGDAPDQGTPEAVGDRDGSEADVIEQSIEVPEDEHDAYPS
ncbi:hypothetical protein [Actinotalea sp. Marseille-Q4924]|uniref:hypothetical protein n=1 Tax=Actinotalea sp. Marseille-Q4924 TaxID=2866571 RepID=UPI001CE3E669|nr:hypothetical protein [Actinotalea sp. Marseille-Q4924]